MATATTRIADPEQVSDDTWTWEVPSSDGRRTYTVRYHQYLARDRYDREEVYYAERWSCTCPAGQHHRLCRHVRSVEATFVAVSAMDAAETVDEMDYAEHAPDNGCWTVAFVRAQEGQR